MYPTMKCILTIQYLWALFHLHHHAFMLFGDGKRCRMNPLIDHFTFSGLKCEQAFSRITHPAQHTQPLSNYCFLLFSVYSRSCPNRLNNNGTLYGLPWKRKHMLNVQHLHEVIDRAAQSDESIPPGLKREPGRVSAVSSEGVERPHDQLDSGVMDVPQVDVLMSDLHCALAVDVQVGSRHQVNVKSLWNIWENMRWDSSQGVCERNVNAKLNNKLIIKRQIKNYFKSHLK